MEGRIRKKKTGQGNWGREKRGEERGREEGREREREGESERET